MQTSVQQSLKAIILAQVFAPPAVDAIQFVFQETSDIDQGCCRFYKDVMWAGEELEICAGENSSLPPEWRTNIESFQCSPHTQAQFCSNSVANVDSEGKRYCKFQYSQFVGGNSLGSQISLMNLVQRIYVYETPDTEYTTGFTNHDCTGWSTIMGMDLLMDYEKLIEGTESRQSRQLGSIILPDGFEALILSKSGLPYKFLNS